MTFRMEHLPTWQAARTRLSQHLEARLLPDRPLDVLDAGCGRSWPLHNVDHAQLRITGIDSDATALHARQDLHAAHIGDIRDTTTFADGSFDLIYSGFVLEHVHEAERALAAFASWLRPGGSLIILIPDARSVRGFITRRTPHQLHIWAYRHILRKPHAGTPGHGPYPVAYSQLLTIRGFTQATRDIGLTITDVYTIGGGEPSLSRRLRRAITWTSRIISLLSLTRLAWRHDDLAFVLSDAGE